ncbi:uncharacterized protein LOC142160025 [Mixophyes fleayi]|uniref:uncharacterized protein LOC142160025 n=1 Tax=Mixophyes fleayi TaxID=3061075 RepID=UPI003F4E08CB
MKMDKDQMRLTERILNITLEIIYLLTGENYTVVEKTSGEHVTPSSSSHVSGGWSRTQSPIMEPPPHSLIHERNNDQRILELTNKIIQLLTGEVPIRCQDVTVYFSMEEWEYLEGHKDLYKDVMMETDWPLTSIADLTEARNKSEGSGIPISSLDRMNKDDIVRSIETANYSSSEKQGTIIWLENVTKKSSSFQEGHFPYTGLYAHTDQTQNTSTHIKEEPISYEKGNIPYIYTPKDHTQYTSSHIKEEPISYEKGNQNAANCYKRINKCNSVLLDHTYAQSYLMKKSLMGEEGNLSEIYTLTDAQYSSPIKDESVSCEENLIYSDLYTPSGHIQYTSICIKEESIPCEEDLTDTDIYALTDHTQYISTSSKEESASRTEGYHTDTDVYTHTDNAQHISTPKEVQRKNEQGHQSIGTSFLCFECGKCFKCKSGLVTHKKIHTLHKSHTCSECGKCFISHSKLLRHKKIHTQEKPYSCPDCGKCFTKTSNLTTHQKIHTRKNLCSCVNCGKCFSSNSNLLRHQKIHIGEKPNYCPVCDTSFTINSELVKHQSIHTEEKPYSCSECGKCFMKRRNLTNHQTIHTRKNPNFCTECRKYFISHAYLARHMKMHTRKKRSRSCPLCGKHFISNIELAVHQRIHTGEEPRCNSEWRKCFIRKLGAVIQQRSHTEDKPYLCSECGECFAKKLQLFRHQKIHKDGKS